MVGRRGGAGACIPGVVEPHPADTTDAGTVNRPGTDSQFVAGEGDPRLTPEGREALLALIKDDALAEMLDDISAVGYDRNVPRWAAEGPELAGVRWRPVSELASPAPES